MDKLRILITNNTLAGRAGSELYVRDVALALLKLGHTPIAYSIVLGEVAEELRRNSIPVIDNLDAMGVPPDIIHGQHHLETMTALLHFVGVPAVYFCHGWLPWEESPPIFPRILRYIAVDQTCKDRLLIENGITEDKIRVLYNFADMERFKPRPSLPLKPERALVFSNQASEQSYLKVIREACDKLDIILDVIGMGSGNPCAHPEKILGNYDLVFAKARAAIEALAVGAAVVLCDEVGAGPMVTTSDLHRLRPLNFGLRTLRESITVDHFIREIKRYDPKDAAEVSKRIRETAGLTDTVDQIVSLYKEVLEEYKNVKTGDYQEESHAAAAYLRRLDILIKKNADHNRPASSMLYNSFRSLIRRALSRLFFNIA